MQPVSSLKLRMSDASSNASRQPLDCAKSPRVDIDPENEEQVRNMLEHVKARSQRCYDSEKFQIRDNRTGKVYNLLEWSDPLFRLFSGAVNVTIVEWGSRLINARSVPFSSW